MLCGSIVGCVHHTGNGCQHRADDEGGGDHHVGFDAHQAGNPRVLCCGPHGTAQFGGIDHPHEYGQGDGGEDQNHHLRGRDDGPTDVQGVAWQQGGVGLVVGLPDDHGQGLQQDGHADGGDQGREFGAVAQRAVGDFLNDKVQRCGHHTGNEQGHHQNQPARGVGHALFHQADHGPAGERPNHHHLAVGEVDQVDDAVDHGVAQRNQGVHAAQPLVHIGRIQGQAQRARVGQANIFAGHAHQAARQVAWFRAAIEHAHHPVQRGVGVGTAHAFVQGGNRVVELLAPFVIAAQALAQDLHQPRVVNSGTLFLGRGHGQRLQGVQEAAGIAIGIGDQARLSCGIDLGHCRNRLCPCHDLRQIGFLERLQHIHGGAGQQG